MTAMMYLLLSCWKFHTRKYFALVLRNEKCFIGTLYEVDSNKNTFSIKQNNGEIIEINCADVEEIFSEEEIGTIN